MASEDVGWPASRYKAAGTAFVVREMSGLHLREARYGEALPTTTCIAESRRGIVLRRETWVSDVFRTTVQWAHVGSDGVPRRAGPDLVEAFTVTEAGSVELPAFTEEEPRRLDPFVVVPWYTEMDPLGHSNHPRYVDWAEESLSRHVAALGADPIAIVPIAETVRFRSGAVAGDRVTVALTEVGRAPGGVRVYDLAIDANGTPACSGRLWRRIPE